MATAERKCNRAREIEKWERHERWLQHQQQLDANEERWDRQGFNEDELPKTISETFWVWVPHPFVDTELPLTTTSLRMEKALRLKACRDTEEWVEPFEFKELRVLDTDTRRNLLQCFINQGWIGGFYFEQSVRGSKKLLELIEGKTFADFSPLVNFNTVNFLNQSEVGIEVPIGFSGLKAKVFRGHPAQHNFRVAKEHPKFPRDRYVLCKGEWNKPVFRLQPDASTIIKTENN